MILDNKDFLELREKYKTRMKDRIKEDGYNEFIIEEEFNSFCDEWNKNVEKYW